MTAEPGDFRSLVEALSSADDEKLLAVVRVVDRLADRGALDAVLDRVRPRLALIRPPRPLTLLRLLTWPLEPALVPAEAWVPGSYRIPRSHLFELHQAVRQGLDPALVAQVEAGIAGSTTRDADVVLANGKLLWPAAAQVAMRESENRRRSDVHLAISFRLAAHLLAIGETSVRTFWQLPPKPIQELPRAACEAVCALLAAAAERGREAFVLVCEILIARCDSPMLILRPAIEEDLPLPLRERIQCVSVVVDGLLGELIRAVNEARAASPINAPAVAELILRVIDICESLESAPAGVRFDRFSIRRLLRATSELAQHVVATVLEQQLLPAMAGRAGEATALSSVEETARAIARIRMVARPLGLVAKFDDLFRRAERRFLEALEVLVAEREQGRNGESPVDLDVMDRVRVIEILFGSRRAVAVWRACCDRARGLSSRIATG